ncbi:MAG TPA: cytochrome c oxidase accessory protein CcoG [Burkholderiaceae bacterium]|nr:cytochrome c oxidase accessory protein CcoG [Burkholderiaceae bacterium]HQR72266.1 cytochrome c oxidase accessory protein CcoG [Burkholderiaceae bacterium]
MENAVEVKRDAPPPVVREARTAAGAEPREVEIQLYAKRKEIYPRQSIGDSLGLFQKWRWAAVWATQIVFYGLPWLTWNGRQALLFDLAARKFYIFGMVLWPQDIIYLTAILIIAALSLFLFTAVGGRLWCGYACPQTVYTEIFMWIERHIEGDRAARMRLDQQPLSGRKFMLKAAKHGAWIAVALWTGFTFVGYFTPIRELGVEVATLAAGGWSLFWILFYSFATYGNAGWMREQVCKYMCPYARFQSAMFDPDTLIVTYDRERGEPRGVRSKKAERSTSGLGDCVACNLCVQVCPTGIDIRNGLQYECIGCAACIDACDYVMEKADMPKGLIRYSTERALKEHYASKGIWGHVLRPRVLVYLGILSAVTIALVVAVAVRIPLKVDVIRDRGALAREVEDGRVENTYRLQVMNTTEHGQAYALSAAGLPGLELASDPTFDVPGATTRSVLVRLRARPEDIPPGSNKIVIGVKSLDTPGVAVEEKTVFLGLVR